MKKIYYIIVLSACLILSYSCKKDANIFLNTYNVNLCVGETRMLYIKSTGNSVFHISSKNPEIATINNKGLIVGKAVGKTKILVYNKNNTISCDVFVNYAKNTIIPTIYFNWGKNKKIIKKYIPNIKQDYLETYNRISFFIEYQNQRFFYEYNFTFNRLTYITVKSYSKDEVHKEKEFKQILKYINSNFITKAGNHNILYFQSTDKQTIGLIQNKTTIFLQNK